MRTKSSPLALAVVLALFGSPLAFGYTWSSSGFGGGGTQNSLAIDPWNSSIIVVGSDVSGFQRSTDGGKTWVGSNQGVTDTSGPQQVAGVTWNNDASTTASKNTVYAACTSGLYISTDAGVTWNLSSSAITFAGNGSSSLRWPRDTGNLIAVDQANSGKYLYAGSYNGGLFRSTDGGATWTNIGLTAYEITGVTWDPNHSSHVYVTTRGNGVFWTSTAHGATPGWNALSGAPAYPEEAVVSGSTLYVVGATTSDSGNYDQGGGLWTSDVSAGNPAAMVQKGAATLPSTTTWTAVAVSGTTVYVGAAYKPGSTGGNTIQRSTDGGSTFTSISASGNVNTSIFDGSGQTWWNAGNAAYVLGGNAAGISQLEVDPNSSTKLVGAIRCACWGTANATAAAGSVEWYPYSGGYSTVTPGGGMGATGCTGLAIDPNHAGYIYVGLSDWTFVYSTDGGATWHRNTTGMPTGDRCDSIWVDPNDGTVYLGQTSYETDFGTVDSTSNVTGTWTNLGPNLSSKIHGVCSGKDGSGHKVILALAENGLWRTTNNGSSWTQNTAVKATSGYTREDFCWNAGSQYVYVYSQDTGLWRSSDYGSTWTNIWSTGSTDTNYTGYLAALPSNPDNTLFISTSTGVFKVTNASTSNPVIPVNLNLPGGHTPGAMCFGGNGGYALYVATVSNDDGLTPAFYKCATPATTPAWSSIGDSVVVPGQGAWCSSVRQDPSSGQLYVNINHIGGIMASP